MSRDIFRDRTDAGRRLVDALRDYANRRDVVVIGLPRGGVAVAAVVARALAAPLDVIVVRKLGVPSHEELGLGAIAEDGVAVFNEEVRALSGVSDAEVQEIIGRQQQVLEQRLERVRAIRPEVTLRDRTVIIVDDGIATGIDARAACRVARTRGAAKIVLAVPAAPADWKERLAGEADEFVACIEERDFMAVGQFYDDFSAVTDEEFLALLVDREDTS